MAKNIRTQGERSVIVEHDVIKSIIATGDHNKFFIRDYVRLRDAYLEPWSVFERVDLDYFIGREWLLAKVEAFLRDHDRGYFIFEAEAGLGKTAFLAWLVKERGYIHHFVELAPGPDGVERGLKNLAAQLILAFKLNPEVLPPVAGRPDYLSQLLKEASEKRSKREKIVLVVDALDEAGTPEGQNVLGLPNVLPEGVYFIVSQRPVPVKLHLENSRYLYQLNAECDDNLIDMRLFLKKAATWHGIVHALEAGNCTSEQFVETMLEKCLGVWIYLKYVIHEIEQGGRSPLNLDSLPDGLTQYYVAYWSRWRDRDEDEWYDIYLPVLTTLTATQEAVTLEHLISLSNVDVRPQKLYRVLREQWRPFLVVLGKNQEERYRFYHATLRDFFEGKVEREMLTSAEEAFVNELTKATQVAHNRFVERYLSAWGSLEKGLPTLEREAQQNIDQGYGLRHMTAHLEASRRVGDLHLLLSLENNKKRNVWFEACEAGGYVSGYVNDVVRAWRCAESSRNPSDVICAGRNIGMQIRYALIIASVNSLSANIPPKLLVLLLETKIWSRSQGLAYARQVPAHEQRIEALRQLSFQFEEPQKTEVLIEALNFAREIKEEGLRARVLARIAINLPNPLKAEVLKETLGLAGGIRNKYSSVKTLTEIAPNLPDPQKALELTRKIGNTDWRVRALARIAPNLPDPRKAEVLDEALDLAGEIKEEGSRERALAEIVPNLPDPQKALDMARKIKDLGWRVRALTRIASNLPDPQRAEVLDEALGLARDIKEDNWRVRALARVAPNLPDPQRAEVLDEALGLAKEIKNRYSRSRELSLIAPNLPDSLKVEVLREALDLAREIKDEYSRARVLTKIAPNNIDPQNAEVLKEALDLVGKIGDEYLRARALAEIVPNLPDPQKALDLARKIKDLGWRVKALTRIASNLPDPQRTEVLNEALDLAREIRNADLRVSVLARIASSFSDPQKALDLAKKIDNEGWRAGVLTKIVPNLPDPQKALDLAMDIRDVIWRARVLTKIAPNLPGPQKAKVLDEALDLAKKIKDEGRRVRALTEVAPNLPDPLKAEVLDEAFDLAKEIRDEGRRVRALTEIARNLPNSHKAEILDEALDLARKIKDNSKIEALTAIAPNLSEPQKNDVLSKILDLARSTEREEYRANILANIAPHLVGLPPDSLYTVCGETLRISSQRTRKNLLSDLGALIPVIVALGGLEALEETCFAIQDVGRWWP